MKMQTLAVAGMVATAIGGVAYVFLYPLLSGEARAAKRQKALAAPAPERRGERGPGAAGKSRGGGGEKSGRRNG